MVQFESYKLNYLHIRQYPRIDISFPILEGSCSIRHFYLRTDPQENSSTFLRGIGLETFSGIDKAGSAPPIPLLGVHVSRNPDFD